MSVKSMHAKGFAQLPKLRRRYEEVLAAHDGIEPDLSQAHWGNLALLLKLARELKGARSWMFASKLCHFLLPATAVVTDGKVTPIFGANYGDSWQCCQEGWLTCPNKDELIAVLQAEMRVVPAPCYPWPTKITELCYAAALP